MSRVKMIRTQAVMYVAGVATLIFLSGRAVHAENNPGPSPQVNLDVKFIDVTTDFFHQIGVDTPFQGHNWGVGSSSIDGLDSGLSGAPSPGGATETMRAQAEAVPLIGKVPSIAALFRNKVAANPSNLPTGEDYVAAGTGGRVGIPLQVTPEIGPTGVVDVRIEASATITRPTVTTLNNHNAIIQVGVEIVQVDDPDNPVPLLNKFGLFQFGSSDSAPSGQGLLKNAFTQIDDATVVIDLDETIPVGVPTLSNLAVIGRLFTGVEAERPELLTFVTPYVIDAENTFAITVTAPDGTSLLVAPEPTALIPLMVGALTLRHRRTR